MSKARGLADLGNVYNDGALSNRNLIINGAMQVAQRGTSFSHTGTHSTYTVDRWVHVTNGTSSTTAQTWTTINSEKVIALTSTSTSSTYNVLLQRLEGLRSLQGKEVTLSAYVKGEAGTFAQYMEFRNSGGSGVFSVNTNLDITTSWQKFTWTVTVPTDASFDNDSSWFNVSFYGGASLDIAQVQLEVGDTATPFEHRSYGDELQRCQRFYCNNFNGQNPSIVRAGNGSNNRPTIGTRYNNGEIQTAPIPLPTTLRASGSVSYYSPSHVYTLNKWGAYGPSNGWGVGMTISGQDVYSDSLIVYMNGASGVSDFQTFIISGYFEIDAEL